MIIVSQNGKEVINLKQMQGLSVWKNKIMADSQFSEGEGRCIGEYLSENLAKEVLLRIIEAYRYEDVYFMPEKDGCPS